MSNEGPNEPRRFHGGWILLVVALLVAAAGLLIVGSAPRPGG